MRNCSLVGKIVLAIAHTILPTTEKFRNIIACVHNLQILVIANLAIARSL